MAIMKTAVSLRKLIAGKQELTENLTVYVAGLKRWKENTAGKRKRRSTTNSVRRVGSCALRHRRGSQEGQGS
jgi:hypothetical protein